MNHIRREKIIEVANSLEECVTRLEKIKEEEDHTRECIPENLQSGDLYQQSENYSDTIQDAIDNINEVAESLSTVV